MKLVEIAACGKNRELGLQGDMPWKRSLKEDLKYFRNTTNSHPMVMGRKTFESLPGMLPGRRHIVITRKGLEPKENLTVYPDLETFLEKEGIQEGDPSSLDEVLYVIGGGSLYKQLLPYCQEILLTEIDAEFPADTWFPEIDPDQFERTVLEELIDGGYPCKRILYKRKDKAAASDQLFQVDQRIDKGQSIQDNKPRQIDHQDKLDQNEKPDQKNLPDPSGGVL